MSNYTEEQKRQWAENRQKNLDFATETLQKGVESVFQSEQYREYLKVMSRFPSYSVNNTILIAMQRPDASLVCSYGHWKKFGRNVKKGAHGIKIYAPMPYTRTVEWELRDPDTKEVLRDAAGHPLTEEAEVKRVSFKVVSVFDLSDTERKDLPDLGVHPLTGEVDEYEPFFEALFRTAKIPVTFQDIEGDANGYYDRVSKEIVLRDGMSQQQTVKTMIHEIAHSRLHSVTAEQEQPKEERPGRNAREVQAESIAFVVSSRYGNDTSDYSFPYIGSWSAGKDTPELKASLNIIRETASGLIDEIDRHLEEIRKERLMDRSAVYTMGEWGIVTVEPSEGGWQCEVYDQTPKLQDSKHIEQAGNADDAMRQVLEYLEVEDLPYQKEETPDLREQIDRANETGFPPILFDYLDREKQIVCDVAVEPVVTIRKSVLPQLRYGMEIPLHIADKVFAQLEQEQVSQHGKRDRKECPAVSYQIDFRSEGWNGHYSDIFYPGSGNGGLLLSMERAANQRSYYLQKHPDKGGLDSCRNILEKMLPTLYQQSMSAENRILEQILPEPVPFVNISLEAAEQDPAIGRKGFFEMHRETVRCAEAMNEGLESAYHHKAIYQFLSRMNREFGPERVKTVLVRTVQLKSYDGRFHQDNRDYANAVPVLMASQNPETDPTRSYNLNAHSVIVDGALRACRKMEQNRKPSIRKRLEDSRKQPQKSAQQREKSKKRSAEHEL